MLNQLSDGFLLVFAAGLLGAICAQVSEATAMVHTAVERGK